jgi:hypothetical protein
MGARGPEFYLNVGVVLLLVLWTWQVGTHLETPYPETLVEFYATPLSRVILLLFILLTAYWNTYAGILAALAFVLLGADISVFGTAP